MITGLIRCCRAGDGTALNGSETVHDCTERSHGDTQHRYPWKKLEELDCLRIARHFAPAWKSVAALLGFTYWEIEAITEDSPGSCVTNASAMLIRWCEREVDEANLNTLDLCIGPTFY